MKHIRKFNETKKEDKVEDQEVLFNAEVLVDKDEKPSFTTDVEDQEKLKKEFDKLRKVKSFESFIDVDIHIDNIDEVEIENDYDAEGHEEESEEEVQEVGCGCCGECTGQSDCDCCQDCTCGDEEEVQETNPETEVKVMNMADFMNSIAGQ
jgi:hypothetical protein